MQILPLATIILTAEICCRASVVLSIDPAAQTIPLSSQASVDVDISGLGGGVALGTYDIDVEFDPLILSYSNIVFGSQLDVSGLGDIQTVTPSSGTVEVFELSLDSASELIALQSDAFKLATLTFNTVSTGTSTVALSVNALGDAYGNSITASLKDASVSVGSQTAVPEPGSFGLLLTIVPVFALARRLMIWRT